MDLFQETKTKIAQFLDAQITAEALQAWAVVRLHALLSGGLIRVEALRMWGILTSLTDLDAIQHEKTIRHLLHVRTKGRFSGQRDGSSVLLSVPAQYHALLAMDSSSNQQLTCLNAIPRNP